MPRRAVSAFIPPPRSESAPIKNRDGYPAWERPLKEQYLQTLLTNTFGNTYYADARTLTAESDQVHTAMLKESPEFAARALLYAREKGYMRTQPLYGLVRLFGVLEGKALAAKIFDRVVRTPNDLADFTSIVKSLRKGEGGRAIKRAAGKWLLKNLSEYWVIKYGAEKDGGAYSLRDMLQVYHPDAGGTAHALFDYVMGGVSRVLNKRYDIPDTMDQIAAYEGLKRADTDEAKAQFIMEGRLPHEVATAHAGTSKLVWEAIVPNLPIFALLRNLATLERHGVAESQRKIIEGKLLDAESVRKSMILPFRFVEAIKHVKAPWLADAVRGALDLACDNVPDIDGLTDVAIDVSGSMGEYAHTAAIFGICLARKSGLRGNLYGFNQDLFLPPVSMRDSILTQAAQFRAGGGTDHSLVMRFLLQERRRVDNLIYITDEQQNTDTPLLDLVDRYRRELNPKLRLFVVDVGPYRSALAPPDPETYFIYGWSDQALGFVSLASRGMGSMADTVSKLDL